MLLLPIVLAATIATTFVALVHVKQVLFEDAMAGTGGHF